MSVSSNLKKDILEALNDEKEHDIQFIKHFLENQNNLKYEKDYTKGHLAGVLHSLMEKGDIICVKRGTYKIAIKNTNEFFEDKQEKFDDSFQIKISFNECKMEIAKVLYESFCKLDKYMSEIKLLEVPHEDFLYAEDLLKIYKELKDFSTKYSKVISNKDL